MDKRVSRAPPNIMDRPLSRGKGEVSLSAFAYLFSELVQYSQGRAAQAAELEKRLEDAGAFLGSRVFDLICARTTAKRETKIVNMLNFISNTVWKSLFGKPADSLEKSTEKDDEYMISERELLINKYISISRDIAPHTTSFFAAGIVKGVLDSAEFPARVTAHYVALDGQKSRTTLLIKFAPEVIARERRS
eukprot:TRINITY_DN996_c0_g1_i1.p1 TRINITY_DN996_c0_g1~~TRINITY_DN996_c0_g1_i1.p1  ORF type:complete len:191 (-),score=44.54 TRINITY_DN996_c0_g1_i1:353-925(-)